MPGSNIIQFEGIVVKIPESVVRGRGDGNKTDHLACGSSKKEKKKKSYGGS